MLTKPAIEPTKKTEPRTFDVTTNYNQFQSIHGNRQLNPSHLKHLEQSILTNNLLSVNPIIVNEKNEIIDGQHRYEVAKKNNLPLYYVVVPNSRMTEVHLLNQNNRQWTLTDYLHSYATLGYKDYQLVKEVYEDLSMPISFIVALLSGMNNRDQKVIDAFRQGTWEAIAPERVEPFGKFLTAIRRHAVKTIRSQREFLGACLVLFGKVDPDAFLAKLKSSGETFEPRRLTTDYLRDFELVWNSGRTNTERLF